MSLAGDNIRAARMAAGLTQKQLGDKAGIAEPTIRRYELGKLNPKLSTLQKIANALGVSVYSIGDFTTSTEAMLSLIHISEPTRP